MFYISNTYYSEKTFKNIEKIKNELKELQKVNNNLEESVSIITNEARRVKLDLQQLIMKIEIDKDKVGNDYILETLNKINIKISTLNSYGFTARA